MAFNFPNSPAPGDIFAPSGGPTYRYSGSVWSVLATPFQGAFPSDTAPLNPVNGQLWWESDTGLLYVFFVDISGPPGQWVEVISSSMPDPPADGNEYVRVNGVWRLSKQTFDPTVMTPTVNLDIPVPAWGPSSARLTMSAITGSNTGAMYMRASMDGTSFPAGATDYSTSGFWRRGDTGAFTNAPNTSTAQWNVGAGSDHPAIPAQTDIVVTLTRGASGTCFGFRSRSSGYQSSMAFQEYYYNGYTPGATWNAATTLKALRLLITAGGASIASGKLTVEWLP